MIDDALSQQDASGSGGDASSQEIEVEISSTEGNMIDQSRAPMDKDEK